MPFGVTSPMPVTTTRSMGSSGYSTTLPPEKPARPRPIRSGSAAADPAARRCPAGGRQRARNRVATERNSLSSVQVLLDVVDGILNASDLLRVFVRDVDLERFFECEHELDQTERIRA